MKNIKLNKPWDSLHSSYWFVPTVMAVSAISLAFMMLTFDRVAKSGLIEKLGWIYTSGPDGARSLLSTVAGSMIAVAAIAFSITLVALQLASLTFWFTPTAFLNIRSGEFSTVVQSREYSANLLRDASPLHPIYRT